MKVDYQSKKSAKSLQNIKNSLQKVCKKSAKRQKKSAKSALTADFADSRRLLKKSARFCPPIWNLPPYDIFDFSYEYV